MGPRSRKRNIYTSRNTRPIRLVFSHESGNEALPHMTRMSFRLLLTERHISLIAYVRILTGVRNSVRMKGRSIERDCSRIKEADVRGQLAVGCERKLEHISHITDIARTPVVRHIAFVPRRDGFPHTHRFEPLLGSPSESLAAFAALH